MRIGIFGGSFDPVHLGHIQMATVALQELSLDKLFLVPTRPWQKITRAGDQDRLNMLKLAFQSFDKNIEIDTRELDRVGQSYSIDTIHSFREEYGETAKLFFIMGADQWKNLTTWIQWEDFPALTNLALFRRNHLPFFDPYGDRYMVKAAEYAVDANPSGAIYLMDCSEIDISSTSVREALLQEPGRSTAIPGLPSSVHRYILENNLYRAS